MLDKNSKIYIAGHHGLVGSAIWNNLHARGYKNLIGRSHKELDLTDQKAVKEFFDSERPDAVVLAAAFVGGICPTLFHDSFFKIFGKVCSHDAGHVVCRHFLHVMLYHYVDELFKRGLHRIPAQFFLGF